ncbi:MAG: hypothetical protein GAK29_01476 [Acinetobacter bereziniae]|uniref:Uncharacterized protein n=1 Tax=Acinetobacter bereziniae TaxID=106648 RepID=A0A833UDR7_ACIBZ|nr:MAG: hypothetical protein GAK29_01476 [Acinetobacter bereziniae]
MKVMSKDFVLSCVEKLNETQHKLFIDYGLRQIKYMFDVDKILEVELPENSKLIGLSEMGRFTAIDHENKIRYGYFPHDKRWSQANEFGNLTKFDSIDDFGFIYNTFKLIKYELNSLTYVHRNYINW